MYKRIFAIIVIVALAVSMLSACSKSKGDGEGEPTANSSSAEPSINADNSSTENIDPKYEKFMGAVGTILTDDWNTVVFTASNNRETIPGVPAVVGANKSLDGTKAVLITQPFAISDNNDKVYYLYYISDNVELIAEDVWGAAGTAYISASGNAVAYVRISDNGQKELILWESSGVYTTILTLDSSASIDWICISPNGKTVGCSLSDNSIIKGFLWDSGNSYELGGGKQIRAVTDNGELVYFSDKDTKQLCVQKSADNESVVVLGDTGYPLLFNKDLTQVVSCSENAYISVNGNKKQPLSAKIANRIVPQGTQTLIEGNLNIILGIPDFKNSFFTTSTGEIVRMDENYKTVNVANAEPYSQTFLADDGKTLTYLNTNNHSVYKIDGLDGQSPPTLLVDGNVFNVLPVSNGKAIYFCRGGNWYYQQGEEKPKLIGKTNNGQIDHYGLFQGKTLYYTNENDELCYSSGGNSTKANSVDKAISSLSADDFGVYVKVTGNAGNGGYRSVDGIHFEYN